MYLPLVLLGIASVIGSGVLFRHQRMLTLLAMAGGLWELQILLLTWLDRVVLTEIGSSQFWQGASVVLLLAWGWQWRKWRWPYAERAGSGWRDVTVLLVLVPVVLAAFSISRSNGFIGQDWVMHGWYHGDTTTLISLVRASFAAEGLVTTNIFGLGEPMEYPTLIHASLATVFEMIGWGEDFVFYLPVITLFQVLITIPMLFLLWDFYEEREGELWWSYTLKRWQVIAGSVVGALLVLGFSWDGYVYLQSHFFLTGLFILTAVLYLRRYWALGFIASILLLFSNAVTGTAALILGLMAFGWRWQEERGVAVRVWSGAAAMVLLLAYHLNTPGDAQFGVPNVSYVALESFWGLVPLVLLIAIGLARLRNSGYLPLLFFVGLVSASFITVLFSTRDLIADNANRFIGHGVLISWPLLVPGAWWLWKYFKEQVLGSSMPILIKAIWSGMALVLVIMMMLPSLGGVARAHDNLQIVGRSVIPLGMRLALVELLEEQNPDTIVIASPEMPMVVPLMTGMQVLRVDDFWLSPQDELLRDLQAAYQGDSEAQGRVLELGDYLLLSADERTVWQSLDRYERISYTDKSSLYRLE